MKKLVHLSALIAVIALSVGWAGWKLQGSRSQRLVAGLIHRSKVDSSGHARGIVQVDLMRQIMAEQARSAHPVIAARAETPHRVPTQDQPLLNQRAPALVLGDVWGQTWDMSAQVRDGPVVLVFYLGSTCMACVTHLTELDVATPRFRERGARVLAVSGDTPLFSLERIRKYGDFQIPLLSDPGHAVAMTYGVWNVLPRVNNGDGTALHGTFIIDRGGWVRWVHVGNRPFTDLEALLAEIDELNKRSSNSGPRLR
jgi:peroxiredoxin